LQWYCVASLQRTLKSTQAVVSGFVGNFGDYQ